MPRLPGRRDEAACGRAKDVGELALCALDGSSGFLSIQAVHLVAALGEQRGGSPTSLTSMEIAVKQKLLGALSDQSAVVRMRSQWPLAMPVRDYGEGETPSENRCKVTDHHPSLTGVGRRGIVNTDKERARRVRAQEPAPIMLPYVPAFLPIAFVRTPPYRRSRAAKARTAAARSASLKSGHNTSVK